MSKVSRREFLRVVGVTASAAALGACTSTPKITPTATAEPALSEVEPIVPKMVLVEAGSFEMGSADDREDQKPVHTVHITRPFYISKYEVTFDQYEQFCDDTVGKSKPNDNGWGRGNRPVVNVSWYDAVEYCNWLSEKEGLTPCYSGRRRNTQCDFSANGYRLPTEAEWEYAARGGQKSQGYEYAGSDNADDVAWYLSNSGGQTHPVGQKQPNELGLYDMSGNAFEWCWDWYGEDYYASSPPSDPTGPSLSSEGAYTTFGGSGRVRRGGSKRNDPTSLRVAFRSAVDPVHRGRVNGFRVVRTG